MLSDQNQIAVTQALQHLSMATGAVADRSDSFRRTLANLEMFTSMLAGRTEPLGKALDQLAAGLEKSGDVSAQVQATLGDVRAGAQAVRRTADTFNRTSQDLSSLSKDGQRELLRLGQSTAPELNTLLARVSDLAVVMQQLAELLEQSPRALLLGKPSGRPGPGEE